MKVKVISDTHINENESNEFEEDSWFTNLINSEYDLLVLNGDIWELLQGTLLGDKMDLISRAHSKVSEALVKNNYRIIHIKGNHDNKAGAEYFGIKSVQSFRLNNTLFIHGHQLDPFYQNPFLTCVAKSVIWVTGILELLNKDIDHWVEKARTLITLSGRYAKKDLFREKAQEFRDMLGFDKIICGHTHQLDKTLDKKYYNSGCGWKKDCLELEI